MAHLRGEQSAVWEVWENFMIDKYQPVIGLEVHVELYTKSKMFCRCSANYFGEEPNTHTCPVCLGMPGALPYPNKQAIEWCIEIGQALNCKIPLFSKFDRKNYFYPDLAKGYQISQYDKPFCINGWMDIHSGAHPRGVPGRVEAHPGGENGGGLKRIEITRAHMEEDTGKLTHAIVNGEKASLIDFNRSGVPLVEIVTEPDFNSSAEVAEYLKRLQQIVRYLGVSSADMEKGDMRLEPNISLRKFSTSSNNKTLPPYKVEVKNINSFKFVEKAIEFEIKRQAEILDKGEIPVQETRGWNEQKNATVSQRSKEEAHDYRYFPEPDIPPFQFTQKQIDTIAEKIPELPDAKEQRLKKQYQLSDYDAEILTRERNMADYFEEAVKAAKVEGLMAKQIANIIINKKPDISKVLPATLVKNYSAASQQASVSDADLSKAVEEVVKENQKAVEDYKGGKENIIMFLVGSVMRKLGGKADANSVKLAIEKKLKG